MPKEVLRSGASTTGAAAPSPTSAAPTVASKIQAELDTLETNLKAMALEPELIKSALANKRKELEAKAANAAPAERPKPPAVPETAKVPAKESPKPKPETPPTAAAAPKAPTPDEALAAAYQEDHGPIPGEEDTPGDDDSPGAESESGTEEESQVVVQNHWSAASDGALTGPIDNSDFKIPQLKIVQGSGPLSKRFNQGTMIYMDQVLFAPPDPDKPGPPIRFIPVSLHKYFRENIKRPDPLPANYVPPNPRNAESPEAVARLGGTTEFTVDQAGNRMKPSWGAAARCMILIERPEGNEHPGFAFAIEIEGRVRYFAAAVMYVNGGQYRSFAKPIIDATNFILVQGTGPTKKIILDKRIWKMQVVKEQSGENMVFNPKIEMLPEMTPVGLREIAMTMRGKSSKIEAES